MRVAVNRAMGTFVLAGLCGFGLAAPAFAAGMAQPKVEYSADRVITGEGRTFQTKVYCARDKERMEMAEGGAEQVTISRLDKKLSWVVMPSQKAYMELSWEQSRKNAPADLRECTVDMKKAGSETVNGHAATRYDMTATCPDGTGYAGSMWVTKDNIPVKIDTTMKGGPGKSGRVLVELKNLKIAKQDPTLFEVPSGYTKMTIPAFGGAGGFMGGATAPRRKAPAEQAASGDSGTDTGRSYTAQPRDTGAATSGRPSRVKKGSADAGRSYTATGRSYTALPRGTGGAGAGSAEGRSYTSQPRDSGDSGGGTLDKAIGAGQKLKRLFGW